jgi:error-prone DNA polymerase
MLPYVELHARSAFSFLRGASIPELYAAHCAELADKEALGHAMALTDVDGVYGSVRFHSEAKKRGIRAHVGAEVTGPGGRYALLCESREGYQNLCRLITRIKLRVGTKHPKPGREARATRNDLEEFSKGLICLTGGDEGALANGLKEGAVVIQGLLSIYGRDHVYVELQRHLDDEEEKRNQAVIALAYSHKLPLVATNGVCYATAAERRILDVFTCLEHKTTLADAGRILQKNSERCLKDSVAMNELFSELPEAIANTGVVSSRLQFTLEDLGYEFPRYPLPPGETIESLLWKLTDEGARRRYTPYHDKARLQIERELKLINHLKLGGYFLIVWDIVRFCRERGILCQGRGSAANSAVCYALNITAVDPVGMGLLFERFLSENREEWPDIDIDLPSGDEREAAIQYVYDRYGKHGAAMTANVITYRGRLAVREAGKVLGFDEEMIGKVAALAPMWGWKDPKHTAAVQFKEAGLDIENPRIRSFLDITMSLQDLPRHLGQHSGGMVVCQGALDSVVPLEPASMSNRVVVQWDKEDCADMGIVKIDLLGLGMMAVLKDCLGLIKQHWREEIDLGKLPENDALVYQTLQKGDTIGMFQVESRAQMATLPRLKPENFYDLVVEVAIIRPGPIVGEMVHPYLARRAKKEPVIPLHPLLEPVLARTLGVPLFQEQLLRMAMVIADFTGAEAEELRRAMGFKRAELKMRGIEERLRAGMAKKGIEKETQDKIVLAITSFARYGFPESHAASFALIAYASAFLKCHYLPAFTCALINNQPMGFYSPAVLVKDAQRHGLRVLPAHVNASEWNCTIEKRSLRLGLRCVRGLRAVTGEAIALARPFSGIDEIPQRIPAIRKTELEMLASVGALNGIDAKHRRDALWKAGRAGRPIGSLLEDVSETQPESPLVQMTTDERLSADYYGTGLTVGRHPMHFQRERMNALGVTPANELANRRNGFVVRAAGCVIVRQRPGTAKGVVFLSVEDETGIFNVIVMPDVFEAFRFIIVRSPYLLVEGPLQKHEGVIHVQARQIEAVDLTAGAASSHDFK